MRARSPLPTRARPPLPNDLRPSPCARRLNTARECKQEPRPRIGPAPACRHQPEDLLRLSQREPAERLTTCPVQTNCGTELEPGDETPGFLPEALRVGSIVLETKSDELRHALSDHLLLAVETARYAADSVRPGGTLLFMSPEGGRPTVGSGAELRVAAAIPALIANLALELAPLRVNLIAAGFIDTPLSASLLGSDLEKRRDQLRATLPIGRVVEPADVAALAVHIMSDTALTGATYTIDGGQRLVSA